MHTVRYVSAVANYVRARMRKDGDEDGGYWRRQGLMETKKGTEKGAQGEAWPVRWNRISLGLSFRDS